MFSSLEKVGRAVLSEPDHAHELMKRSLQATLAQLCRGERPARRQTHEITLFKSVGSALQDLAGAQLVWQGAR